VTVARGGRWKTALRCLPLCFLAVVLYREKPWTVRLAAGETGAGGAFAAIAASILLNFAVLLPLKAARWRVALTAPPPFRQVLAATIEGLLANAAIGFGSGDLVRAARLRRGADRPASGVDETAAKGGLVVDYAASWAERAAEALALAILILLAAPLFHLGRWAVALSALGVAAYVALIAGGRFIVPRLGRWPRIQGALSSALQASTPRRVGAMVALSLLGWGVELVMLVLFQAAFHLEPSARTALLTLVGINAAILIPALPGNFGTFEAGAIMALVLCGTPREVAVSYALTYHLSHVVPVAVVATLVYLSRSRRYMTTPARTSTFR